MGHYFRGLPFYLKLKPNADRSETEHSARPLYSDYPPDTLNDKIVVCHVDDKNTRLFGCFNNYIDFAVFMTRRFGAKDRNFFEVVHSSFQKPHFDLEIECEEPNIQLVIDDVITGIIGTLLSVDIDLDMEKDVLVFTSSGQSGNGYKQSAHIIIDNYVHEDHHQAKAFYGKVMNYVNKKYTEYVDKSVYSSIQQFRIVGNRKPNSDRPKKFVKEWKYKNQTYVHEYIEEPIDGAHEFMLQLSSSLLTNTTNCRILPPFVKRADPDNKGIKHGSQSSSATSMFSTSSYNTNDIELTIDDGKNALQLLADMAGITINDNRFPYRLSGIQGSMIFLKRVLSSNCRLCNRIHDNENPYMFVVDNEWIVYFNCRRCDPHEKLYVGKLKPKTSPSNSPSHQTPPEDFNTLRKQLQDAASRSVIKKKKKPSKITTEAQVANIANDALKTWLQTTA